MIVPDLIKNLSSKDLFKIILWGCIGFYIPVSIISGLLALFDIVPANLNGQHYTGIKGFIIPILSGPIFVILLAGAQWIILVLGLIMIRWGIRLFTKSK